MYMHSCNMYTTVFTCTMNPKVVDGGGGDVTKTFYLLHVCMQHIQVGTLFAVGIMARSTAGGHG